MNEIDKNSYPNSNWIYGTGICPLCKTDMDADIELAKLEKLRNTEVKK